MPACSSKLGDNMNLLRGHCSLLFRVFVASRFLPASAAAILMAGVLSCAVPGFAQGTKVWTQTRFEDFEKGTPSGVEIGSDGKLRAGLIARQLLTTPSSFVWAVAADKSLKGQPGTVYLGTGSPASVLRVTWGSDGKAVSKKIFETKALAVQAVALGPDGSLYAATIPDGRVYRLKPEATADESSAEVVFDLAKVDGDTSDQKKSADGATDGKKARYIWDLTFDSAGRLYVATGGPAAIYRIDVTKAKATPELFFKSDEQHIRTLAWDKANLIAGSDGSGLVYRIDPNGKGYVLFSAPRREITDVAVGADGTIYTADVGDKAHNPLPLLPVQNGQVGITISFVQPGSVQAANASTSLPEGSEIYALKPNQAPRKLWSDKDAVVYDLAITGDGGGEGLTVLTGNRGRIFTIHKDGSYSDVAHLDAQQAVVLEENADGWLVGTANTGMLYRLGPAKEASISEDHAFASDVLDAGALARWGRVEADPESHGFVLWTRSGNVEQPVRRDKDWGWSEWQRAANDKIASPPGRYLQWKVVLASGGEVGGVGVNYLPVDSAPVVDDVVVTPGARVNAQAQAAAQVGTISIAFPNATANAAPFDGTAAQPIVAQKDRGAVTVRWAAHDDDGDDLTYDLFLRGDGEHGWLPLKKGLTEKVYSFDATAFPDGGYRIRIVASDAASHSPGDALTGELTSERFELDTTPPVISELKAGAAVSRKCKDLPCPPALPVSFKAVDGFSAIAHAEYSLDGGPWQYIEPVGGLSDAKEEQYSVLVPVKVESGETGHAAQEHLITVRVYDRHENMATAKVIVPTTTPAP
jgi:hypothetical protein